MEGTNMKQTAIEDLETDKFVNITAEVIQLWDNTHEKVRQVGLLRDDTGIVKFISWEVSKNPLLELDTVYELSRLPVSEYEGQLSVALVKTSVIKRIGQTEIPTA